MTTGTTSNAEKCVKACAERAWRLARALVWNAEDANDVVQQACLVAATKPDQIPADDPWPWFARVVTLECLKLRETRARTARLATGLEREIAMAYPEDAASRAESAELQARLRTALGDLPAELRDALTLTHIGGMSVREAAGCLGVSSSTVDRRVRRGLEGLRNRLGGKESTLSAALYLLPLDDPPQGMQQALSGWLRTVRNHGVAGASTGATQMAILKYAGLIVAGLTLVVAGFCVLHHEFGSPENAQELHEMLWRTFHGG